MRRFGRSGRVSRFASLCRAVILRVAAGYCTAHREHLAGQPALSPQDGRVRPGISRREVRCRSVKIGGIAGTSGFRQRSGELAFRRSVDRGLAAAAPVCPRAHRLGRRGRRSRSGGMRTRPRAAAPVSGGHAVRQLDVSHRADDLDRPAPRARCAQGGRRDRRGAAGIGRAGPPASRRGSRSPRCGGRSIACRPTSGRR